MDTVEQTGREIERGFGKSRCVWETAQRNQRLCPKTFLKKQLKLKFIL
jgi:hypothetical protein